MRKRNWYGYLGGRIDADYVVERILQG